MSQIPTWIVIVVLSVVAVIQSAAVPHTSSNNDLENTSKVSSATASESRSLIGFTILASILLLPVLLIGILLLVLLSVPLLTVSQGTIRRRRRKRSLFTSKQFWRSDLCIEQITCEITRAITNYDLMSPQFIKRITKNSNLSWIQRAWNAAEKNQCEEMRCDPRGSIVHRPFM